MDVHAVSERLSSTLTDYLARREAVALVTVSEVKGSTPREAGARMLVSARDVIGTIGGGAFEWEVIATAREMLSGSASSAHHERALGPDIGQCCGGYVESRIERADTVVLSRLIAEEADQRTTAPLVIIYGAGHVGRALASALAPLPFRVQISDDREDELALVTGADVERLSGSPTRVAEAAPGGAAHVVLTHSHSLDSRICATLLEDGRFAYLGLIGSKTKLATFKSAFRAIDIPESQIARIVCPIGGRGVRDKRPAVIAALTTAELVEVFATQFLP
ncbi:MAG: xanthine dehydrogenase accessory protein XdhC [Leifsonia xyli]|jgi:xanthine dehydrogenase accessory factor|nr:MAG: xanthine dehydrogenase accessory protein XdhC [Leifsonia xyli]